MTKLLFTLQPSFNTPEYTSTIGEAASFLFKVLVVVVVIALIYKLIKPKNKK